jgi:hypothetical protein
LASCSRMSCITHGCVAIALELRQSMDHSFEATCSLFNGMPPASKSALDNFETLPERRADVSSAANVDVKLHDSPMCPEGPQAHVVSGKRRGRLKFTNRASCTRISGIFFQKSGLWPLGCVGSARLARLASPTVGRVWVRPCSRSLENLRNPASAPPAHDTRTESCFRRKLLHRAMLTAVPDEIEKLLSTV